MRELKIQQTLGRLRSRCRTVTRISRSRRCFQEVEPGNHSRPQQRSCCESGQSALPASGLPPNLKAVVRKDFIDLLDRTQLAKFGLNINADHDTNTLVEKWEALALIPLHENRKPDDYLLLIGSDNDFKAPATFHNGQAVGTNVVSVDIMVLGYRVTLPGASPR